MNTIQPLFPLCRFLWLATLAFAFGTGAVATCFAQDPEVAVDDRAAETSTPLGLDDRINEAFEPISNFALNTVFFQIGGVPFVLLLLVFSALFFTVYFGFVNITRFPTAINVVRGKYDHVGQGHGRSTIRSPHGRWRRDQHDRR